MREQRLQACNLLRVCPFLADSGDDRSLVVAEVDHELHQLA
ncbi:MAG: hypothetical protein P8Y01_09010 [Woeseiaceae bacterium]